MPTAGQVSNELERCVVELLQARPDAVVPLSDLQAAIDARLAIALERSVSDTTATSRPDNDVLRVLQHSVLQLWRMPNRERAPALDNAVNLFDTVRTALRSWAETE